MRNNLPYRAPRFNTNEGPGIIVPFIAVFILVAILFGIDRLTDGALRSYVRGASGVLTRSLDGVGKLFADNKFLSSRRSLVRENEMLKGEIMALNERLLATKVIESDNASLRKLAHLVEQNSRGVSAPVLSSLASAPYGTFLIGVGRDEGVHANDIVVTPGGFVLGIVTGVEANTSQVSALFSSSDPIHLLTRAVAFDAEGKGGGNARAKVPREAQVSVGDVVTLPSLSGRSAGIIGQIESASTSAYATLYIHVPDNLNILPYVYVISHE